MVDTFPTYDLCYSAVFSTCMASFYSSGACEECVLLNQMQLKLAGCQQAEIEGLAAVCKELPKPPPAPPGPAPGPGPAPPGPAPAPAGNGTCHLKPGQPPGYAPVCNATQTYAKCMALNETCSWTPAVEG